MATILSQDDLLAMWLIWAIIAAIVAIFCITIICGIITSPHARTNPFNLYILYLTIPDALYSILCSIGCFLNVSVGRYFSPALCEAQSWFHVFGIAGNTWMNAVIARQIHKLLRDSAARRRHRMPPLSTVSAHAASVYLFASFLASWGLLKLLPHEAQSVGGMVCFPLGYDLKSTIFFWIVFVPALVLVPFLYIVWVFLDVQRQGLLPSTGRSRNLFIFFSRIALVFLLFWLPSFVMLFVLNTGSHSWIGWLGGTLTHLQAIASGFFAMSKPDVRRAVKDFLFNRERNSFNRREELRTRRSSMFFLSITRSGSLRPDVVNNSDKGASMQRRLAMRIFLGKISEECESNSTLEDDYEEHGSEQIIEATEDFLSAKLSAESRNEGDLHQEWTEPPEECKSYSTQEDEFEEHGEKRSTETKEDFIAIDLSAESANEGNVQEEFKEPC